MLNWVHLNTITFVTFEYLIIKGKNVFISQGNFLLHGERTLLLFFIRVSIPCLISVINIWLSIFFSVSEAIYSYISMPLVATLCIFQDLPQYCIKSTVNTQMLNMLHSHQQHTAAVYINVCVM